MNTSAEDQSQTMEQIREAIENSKLEEKKSGRGWGVAWVLFFLYIVIGVGLAFLLSGEDKTEQLPRESMFFFVPIFGFLLAEALLKKKITNPYMKVTKAETPMWYWIYVSVYSAGTVVMLFGGIGALLGLWN